MLEQWRPVVGYEGYYEVSDQGRVRGQTRTVTDRLGRNQILTGRVLKPQKNSKTDHLHVTLNQNGGRITRSIHRLVLAAFVGPCPDGMEVLHWDDNPHNNNLMNLRYGTRAENVADAIRNGNEDHPCSRKLRCKRGHLLVEGNLYACKNRRGRTCRLCSLERARQNRRALA